MRILVFGDSIVQGFNDEVMGGWCNRLIKLVMCREIESDYAYNKSVFNLGISDDTTDDLRKRIVSESEARLLKYPVEDGDVLILAIGVNDSQFEVESRENKIPVVSTISNLEALIEQTKHLFTKVVVIGLTPVVDERLQPIPWKPTHAYSNAEILRYNEALQQFAIEKQLTFVDMDSVYAGENHECLPDGLHPNESGHLRIYEHVKLALEKEGIL